MHDEFFTEDSIKNNDSMQYHTLGGRVIYGGGRIMPDIFIPRDTIGITSYYSNVINTGVLYQFALDYSEQQKERLSAFEDYQALYSYLQHQPLLHEFADYAAGKGIKKRPALMAISKELITNLLHAYVVRNFFDYDGFYPIFLKDDETIHKAIEVINDDTWCPVQ